MGKKFFNFPRHFLDFCVTDKIRISGEPEGHHLSSPSVSFKKYELLPPQSVRKERGRSFFFVQKNCYNVAFMIHNSRMDKDRAMLHHAL